MLFIVATLIIFALSALLTGLFLYQLNKNKSRFFPEKKQEILLYAGILFGAMLLYVPLLLQVASNYSADKFLRNQAFAEIIRKHHPDLYKDLQTTIKRRQKQNSSASLEYALDDSLREVYSRWIRSIPNSSTDAIMRYVRYRYIEADILARENDDLCRRLASPDPNQISDRHIAHMRKNHDYIEEAMAAVFASSNTRRQQTMPYPDRRLAARISNQILLKLNQAYEKPPAPFADYYGCEFQKAYYLELLEYPDSDIAKIIRWTMGREIETFDKQARQSSEAIRAEN